MKNFTSVLALCMLLNSTASFAQPGTLDTTFGNNGEVITKIVVSSDAKSVAIQSDGKIVVAGSSYDGFTDNFAVARYKPNGTIDASFGIDGVATTDFGGDDYDLSVAIQSDGKIVVAGFSYKASGYNFALARYKHNGKLDSTFGNQGKVTTDFGGDDFGMSVVMLPGGNIAVAGFTSDGSNNNFALARYRYNGKLDSSFGTNGKVTTNFNGSSSAGYSIAVQKDGKILVAGTNYAGYDFALTRYRRNGTLDSAFGINGLVITDFGGDDHGQSVVIQPDGMIVVAGYSNYNFALARYRRTGKLDNGFGVRGKVTTDFGSFDYGQSVAIQADGKIVLAGYSSNGSNYDFALARYNMNGAADNTFGVNGKVTNDFGSDDYSSSVAIQADEKIVEAGGSNSGFTIVRYNGDSVTFAKSVNNNFSNLQKQENKISPGIYLFPNPTSDVLHVQGLSSSAKTISVMNMAGSVMQKTVTSNNNYDFNVKQLTAGIYFVRIDEGTKITELKFIKK